MKNSPQEYKPISTHPNFIYDWAIDPNGNIFPIVSFCMEDKQHSFIISNQNMIQLFKIKVWRCIIMITNLNILFQHTLLLHIIIWIICNFFHKISWEIHVQNHANDWFFLITNSNLLFLPMKTFIGVSFCLNYYVFKSITGT